MKTTSLIWLFSQIFLTNTLSAHILRNEGEVTCDPSENPSSCPTNRRCEDNDGDGEYTCVCDSRFYTTHTLGHCVLGLKALVYDMEKELKDLEMKQEQDFNRLNDTIVDLLEIPSTTTTTTTTTLKPNGPFILIATGFNQDWTQVVDMSSNTICANFPPYPLKVRQADGGLVDDNPVICGGKVGNSAQTACYKYDMTSDTWTKLADSSHSRYLHASTVVNGALMITGGKNLPANTNTDFINLDGSVDSVKIEHTKTQTRFYQRAVTLHDGRVMLLGGGQHDGYYTIVEILNITDHTAVAGPNLKSMKQSAGVTLFNSLYHGNRPVVLAAGGGSSQAEILDYTTPDADWEIIEPLPTTYESTFWESRAVPSISGHGAYFQFGDRLYELTCTLSSCNWSIIDIQLTHSVNSAVMMYLPSDFEC